MLYLRNQQVSRQTSKGGERSIPLNSLIINIVMRGQVENRGAARPFVDAAKPRVSNFPRDLGRSERLGMLERNSNREDLSQ